MLSAAADDNTALLRRELGFSPVFPALLKTLSKMGHGQNIWLNVPFHKPPIYFCHQTSAQRQLSWPKTKEGKVGEDHSCTPHSHFLKCVSSFSWSTIGLFSQVHSPQETATSWSQGNSRVKEVKNFQWEQLNSATSCPKNMQWLQSDKPWKLPWTMGQSKKTWASPTLSRTWEQVTRKIGMLSLELIFLWSDT